jgi:2-iminobutanoate/2-iminopropanoate deaminase
LPPEKDAVVARRAPSPGGHYSHAIRSGGFLFVAGQTPLDPESRQLVSDDVAQQTRQCLKNLQAICEEAGAALDATVRCCVYVTDIAEFSVVNEAYAGFFTNAPPARTTIGVAGLPVGAQVEIDAIVALP